MIVDSHTGARATQPLVRLAELLRAHGARNGGRGDRRAVRRRVEFLSARRGEILIRRHIPDDEVHTAICRLVNILKASFIDDLRRMMVDED